MKSAPNPFARTRADHGRELAEDYVELIHRLGPEARTVDLARALGVAQPTVTKALARLEEEGLVTVRPRRSISLTDRGREIAEASLSRHRLVVAFLVSLGVPEPQAELDAEGIEHHVSEVTLAAMRRVVETPP